MFKEQYSIDALKAMKFGKLRVTEEAEPKIYVYDGCSRKSRMMYCTCDCGKSNVLVSLNNLVRHHTMSCGCYKSTYSKQFLKNYRGTVVDKVI